MDELVKAAKAYKQLSDYEYNLILGRKGTTVKITIAFKPINFSHLAGLQYINLDILKKNKGAIFEISLLKKSLLTLSKNEHLFLNRL